MVVNPSHSCVLPLIWGLTLLMIPETIAAENAVSNAIAAVPIQHMKTYTPSYADSNRALVEERVFPISTVTGLIGHEFHPFADTFISKEMVDKLHLIKISSDFLRGLSSKTDAVAITLILDKVALKKELFRDDFLLIWFGTKSPKSQKAAITALLDTLKTDYRTKFILADIIANGKKAHYLSYELATAVERKLWLSLSTSELYQVLGISNVHLTNEQLFKFVGWNTFGISGEKVFIELMLKILRERSKNKIMWADIIYKLQSDENDFFLHCKGLFNILLQTYDTAGDVVTPFDAVKILTTPELLNVLVPKTIPSNEFGMSMRNELLKLSQDELMWAKLMYMLRDDKSAITFYPDVFDKLLQPYNIKARTPSEALKHLANQDFALMYEPSIVSENDAHAFRLKKLLDISDDKLMWTKVLHTLQYEESLSAISGVLHFLIDTWTYFGAQTNHISFSESTQVLTSSNFLDYSLFMRFINDNPDKVVLEVLRKRSTDEVMWARALYNLQLSNYPSGVLDALLHSWVENPFKSIATTEMNSILIRAYDTILRSEAVHESRQPTDQVVYTILHTLLELSNDEMMWARFLHKLQQDNSLKGVVSRVFDILLSKDFKIKKGQRLPSDCVRSQTTLSTSTIDLKTLEEMSLDELMWAKLLNILHSSENVRLILGTTSC
ncbi:hypothetical protein Plhal703r1_c30g0118981 [Plasmopara halstedii]